jgi:preprotein translocase subunit YajC
MPTIIAQATSAAAAPAGTPASGPSLGYSWILIYGLFIGGFYFLFIAPQKKKQKEKESMLSKLQSGDEIITTGGIYGTITNVKEDRFVVRISDNTKIEVGKAFVQDVTKRSGSEEKKTS